MAPAHGSNLKAAEIGVERSVCVDSNTTIVGISKLMRNHHVGDLVVADYPGGKFVPVGVVSALDIVTRIVAAELDPAVVTVGDIVWSQPACAKIADSVSATLTLLQETGNKVLPVIDRDGRLAGIVSLEGVLRALTNEVKS